MGRVSLMEMLRTDEESPSCTYYSYFCKANGVQCIMEMLRPDEESPSCTYYSYFCKANGCSVLSHVSRDYGPSYSHLQKGSHTMH